MIFNLDDFGIKQGIAKKTDHQGLRRSTLSVTRCKNWLQLLMFGFIYLPDLFLEYVCHQQTWAKPQKGEHHEKDSDLHRHGNGRRTGRLSVGRRRHRYFNRHPRHCVFACTGLRLTTSTGVLRPSPSRSGTTCLWLLRSAGISPTDRGERCLGGRWISLLPGSWVWPRKRPWQWPWERERQASFPLLSIEQA